jgi:hypothetical protein
MGSGVRIALLSRQVADLTDSFDPPPPMSAYPEGSAGGTTGMASLVWRRVAYRKKLVDGRGRLAH